MFNENQDIFGIDQTTPRRDAELFNKTEFDKGFGEAFTESVYGTVGENLLRYAATMPKLQNLGLIPQAPKSWGPNIPANELNKKFGVDIFKDDMSEHQALMIKTIRDLKNKELQRSSIYDGGTFLGQNAPQWAGGFVGTAVSNPLVTLPYGRAATTLGTVGQGIVSNMTGAVLDWSYRKQMESRTGDEATVAQLLTDLSVGTAFGIGADVVANKVRGRKAFDLDKSPEELLGIKREKELATPDKPQTFKSWVEQAHSDYLQRRAEMVDSLSSGYAKEGIRVDMNTLGKMIDPYPHKIDIVEVTHADGTKQKMMVPRDANQVDYDNIGNVKRKIPEDATFKVDGEEFPTLERANEVAKTTNSDVEVTLKEGETFRLTRIEVEKEINAAKEAFRVKKMNDFIGPEAYFEVDGVEFDDLGKAAAFAKAVNSKVDIIDADGKITKIDPPIEFIPENPIVKDQGTKAQFGDPEAITQVKAIVDNPDARELIDFNDVKTFQEFDTDSVKMNNLAEFEKEIDFMVEGFDTEIKSLGDKAPNDLIKHLEAINEIDKTAEVEDNVFKAITSCILRNL